jgi:hypothetical protein
MRGWSVLIWFRWCARAERAPPTRAAWSAARLPDRHRDRAGGGQPDEARLSLGVQSQGASAAEAARANREKMDRVTRRLPGSGVKGDDLQTRNLSLQRIDYGPSAGASARTMWWKCGCAT